MRQSFRIVSCFAFMLLGCFAASSSAFAAGNSSAEALNEYLSQLSDDQKSEIRTAIRHGNRDELTALLSSQGVPIETASLGVDRMLAIGDGASDKQFKEALLSGEQEFQKGEQVYRGELSSQEFTDWLSTDLPVDPGLGKVAFVDGEAGDSPDTAVYISSPDIVRSETVGGAASNENAAASPVSDLSALTQQGWQFIRSPSGDAVSGCSESSCESPKAYLRSPDGSDYSVEVSRHQGGALLAFADASTQSVGPSDQLNAWMQNSSHRDRILAAQMVSEVVPDESVASSVTSSFEVAFGSTELSGIQSGATQLEIDYVSALTMGQPQDALNARMDLLDFTAQQYEEMGSSPQRAREMASAYVNASIERPFFTGVDKSGYLTTLMTENTWLQAGSAVLSPEMVAAFDQTYQQEGSFVPRYSGLDSVSAVSTAALTSNPTIPTSSDLSRVVNAAPGTSLFTGGVNAGGQPLSISGGTFTILNTNNTGGITTSSSPALFEGGLSVWASQINLPTTDMMYVSFERLFGGVVTTIYNSIYDESSGNMKSNQSGFAKVGQPTAITFVISSVTFFVMMFASAILCYMIVYGAYRSAQDGQLMGKEWNTYWVLSRSAIHTVLVIPNPILSGFSSAQSLIIVFALFGTAIASTVGYVAFYFLMTQPVVQPNIVQDEQLVAAIAKGHACVELLHSSGLFPEGDKPSDSPYQLVMKSDGNVTVDGNVPNFGSNTPDNSLFARVKAFFSLTSSGQSDPLESTTDVNLGERNRTIGRIYKTTGINPYSNSIRRLKFGPSGECGVIYVPDFQTVQPENVNQEVLRAAGIRTETSYYSGTTSNIERDEAKGINDFNDALAAGEFSSLQNSVSEGSQAWLNDMRTARTEAMKIALDTLNADVKTAVTEYLNGNQVEVNGESRTVPPLQIGPFAARLTRANEAFFNTLASQMQQTMRNVTDPSAATAAEVVRKLGWMSLGTFYWTLESRQVKIAQLYDFSQIATYERNGITHTGDGDVDEFQREYESVSNLIDRSVGPVGVRLAKQVLDQSADGMTPDTASIGQGVANLVTGALLTNSWAADIDNLNVSPIEQVRHMGVTVTNTAILAQTILATMEASGAGMSTLPSVSGAPGKILQSIASSISQMVAGLMEPALMGAFVAANIIPAMPYAFMLVAAMGYLVYVIEAVVGVNFWSVMSAHPDGHDIWGKGGSGYPIMLTLLIRPLFIVLGFFVGIGFNWVMGHWINITVVPSNTMQNAGTSTIGLGNLSQLGGLIVVFTGLHFYACWKSYGLSWELPNAILRWMGVQDHQDLGEREGKETLMAIGSTGGRALAAGTRTSRQHDDDVGGGSGSTTTSTVGQTDASEQVKPPSSTYEKDQGAASAPGPTKRDT